MAVELDHPFTTTRAIDDSFAVITDLERVIPCVEGGSILEQTGDHAAKAHATVMFRLHDGGGTVHTNAQITGKAASMGEGVIAGVLDGLIKDFTGKLGAL
jgi:carbon monoxide dehydrogenase subunit G